MMAQHRQAYIPRRPAPRFPPSCATVSFIWDLDSGAVASLTGAVAGSRPAECRKNGSVSSFSSGLWAAVCFYDWRTSRNRWSWPSGPQ